MHSHLVNLMVNPYCYFITVRVYFINNYTIMFMCRIRVIKRRSRKWHTEKELANSTQHNNGHWKFVLSNERNDYS